MGKASRARRGAGVVTLTEGQFYRIRHAIAARDLYTQQAQAEINRQTAALEQLFTAAGLDPRRTYQLDPDTLTAKPT